MVREDIKNTIIEIFEDLSDDTFIEINEDTSRERTEEWDSLFHMAFMATVAQEFSLQFKTEDIVNVKTLGDVINLVVSLA